MKNATCAVLSYQAVADNYLGRGEAPGSCCFTSVSWSGQMAGTTNEFRRLPVSMEASFPSIRLCEVTSFYPSYTANAAMAPKFTFCEVSLRTRSLANGAHVLSERMKNEQ